MPYDEKTKARVDALNSNIKAFRAVVEARVSTLLPEPKSWSVEVLSFRNGLKWTRTLKAGGWFDGAYVSASIEFEIVDGGFRNYDIVELSAVLVSVEARPWGSRPTKTRRIPAVEYKSGSRTVVTLEVIADKICEHITKHVPAAIEAVTRALEERNAEEHAQHEVTRQWKSTGLPGIARNRSRGVDVEMSHDQFASAVEMLSKWRAAYYARKARS